MGIGRGANWPIRILVCYLTYRYETEGCLDHRVGLYSYSIVRTRVVNFINAGGGYITSSRRTVQLGYTYGIWEIPYTKINQVDASYTGRTVQRRAPLDILTLWFRWSEMPSLPIEDDCSPVLLYCISLELKLPHLNFRRLRWNKAAFSSLSACFAYFQIRVKRYHIAESLTFIYIHPKFVPFFL